MMSTARSHRRSESWTWISMRGESSARGSAQTHPFVDRAHRLGGDRCELGGAVAEHLLDVARFGGQLGPSVARWSKELEQSLRQQLLGVDAAGPRCSLAVPDRLEV